MTTAGLLGIAFIILKLTNVIAWSWWWVLAPFWIGFAIWGVFVILAVLGIALGLATGVAFGYSYWFMYGGYTVIQHIALRRLLYRDGAIPQNYARILDYAASLIFLRKVGGGYIFVHRYLLEYFAGLEA